MKAVIVVNNPKHWPFNIPDVEVISARAYLTQSEHAQRRGTKVFNLCKSYRYQSSGYYVSLLATARGHKPVPTVATIQDMKAAEIVRIRSDELDTLVQRSLSTITSDSFELSVYFGKNLARRHDRLASHLFKLFHVPFLRAAFTRASDEKWQLQTVLPIAADEIPEGHHDFVIQVATEYFGSQRWSQPKLKAAAFDLAILYDRQDVEPPSDERAIAKFMRAAQEHDMAPRLIEKDDYATLGEYDALFIRETTNVNHHTYRFARRAVAEGLVVVDDPESIVRCTNKVYLAELLQRYEIAAPKTLILHRENLDAVAVELGFPCILKKPDSAFSQGVTKVDDYDQLMQETERLLSKSDLAIAQEFMPTDFDWRVGVFDRKPLWVCRYFMAPKHWQIYKDAKNGHRRSGRVEAVRLADVPSAVVKTAVRAANLIGDGLYGVDLKQIGKKVFVVEINDNPSIEAGYEDTASGDEIYDNIMRVFRRRLDAQHDTRHVG